MQIVVYVLFVVLSWLSLFQVIARGLCTMPMLKLSRPQPVVWLLLFAALLPMTGGAQKFKDPAPAELSMTSDPQAPGAPAVYLYREDLTDNFNHFISTYARIKILTPEGLHWAEVPLPTTASGHRPVIEARVIHPDGKIIALNAAASDAVKTGKDGSQYFVMPDATVGSLLEYRWTLAMDDADVSGVSPGQQEFQNSALASAIPFWVVQQDLFVHKEHFYYNPLTDMERNVIGNLNISRMVDGELAHYILFSAHLPAGAQVQASPKQDYALDLVNVPAFVKEPEAPPADNVRYSVRFYFTPYVSADTYWAAEGKRWSQRIDQLAASTSELRTAAAQLTAGATTDDAKARKLYDAVQSLGNTSFSSSSAQAESLQTEASMSRRDAQTVWAAKSGTPNELALVYLALARAAGLHASAMRINDRRVMFFDPGYLSLDQLPVLLVVLHTGTGDVFLDPGEKMLPYGDLHWAHTLCGGILQTAAGPVTNVTTPPNNLKEAVRARLADISLDAHGGLTGTVKLLMNGPFALRWRQRNLTEGSQAIQSELGQLLSSSLPPGVSGTVQQIQGLSTRDGYFEVVAKVSGQLGKADGRRLEVPGFFFTNEESTSLATTSGRSQPVSMQFAGQEIDNAVFHLPSGFTVASAPQNLQLPWPGHAAFLVNVQPGAGVLNAKKVLAHSFILLPVQQFPDLQSFYQKVNAVDQQSAVFAATGPTGN